MRVTFGKDLGLTCHYIKKKLDHKHWSGGHRTDSGTPIVQFNQYSDISFPVGGDIRELLDFT